jgi:hypothetical protein
MNLKLKIRQKERELSALKFKSDRTLKIFALLLFLWTMRVSAQPHKAQYPSGDSHGTGTVNAGSRAHPKHKIVETELEIYPFNMVVPNDPVIKNEAMFDFHAYSDDEKFLGGVRFFTEANTHYRKERDMKDLLMYTEGYYGLENFQLGVELGSVTGEEYLSVGPQFTIYDNVVFKRVSISSRIFPDLVLGYEFTTQELVIFEGINLSATGMCRLVIPCDERIVQVSSWISFEHFKGFFIGLEYEYNNADFFNAHTYERNHEVFLGAKFELH